jgi:hypothetical protein
VIRRKCDKVGDRDRLSGAGSDNPALGGVFIRLTLFLRLLPLPSPTLPPRLATTRLFMVSQGDRRTTLINDTIDSLLPQPPLASVGALSLSTIPQRDFHASGQPSPHISGYQRSPLAPLPAQVFSMPADQPHHSPTTPSEGSYRWGDSKDVKYASNYGVGKPITTDRSMYDVQEEQRSPGLQPPRRKGPGMQ